MLVLLTILLGILTTEVIGYAVHRMIHTGKVKWLEQNHMEHHLDRYPPKGPQRTKEYLGCTKYRQVFGVGLEWIIPITLVAVPGMILIWFIGVPVLYIGLGATFALLWAAFAFSHMHDGMHVSGFWANRFKTFKERRRLHDIHHNSTDKVGKMDVNYGIMWYGLDRLFGTYRNRL